MYPSLISTSHAVWRVMHWTAAQKSLHGLKFWNYCETSAASCHYQSRKNSPTLRDCWWPPSCSASMVAVGLMWHNLTMFISFPTSTSLLFVWFLNIFLSLWVSVSPFFHIILYPQIILYLGHLNYFWQLELQGRKLIKRWKYVVVFFLFLYFIIYFKTLIFKNHFINQIYLLLFSL